jgi:2-polyprenyl-3-methyl-5-hydroxy-6-metoxy-1,4-benzoquinol methylase
MQSSSQVSGSEAFYEILAPGYREYCRTKAEYLDSIDRLVIEQIPPSANSLLDIGAGDGVRAQRIAQARGLETLVLLEPSKSMAAFCHERTATVVWAMRAEHLPESDHRFDVITCLWNVLGHIPDDASRVTSLRRMRSLLTNSGRIFLDVNNRYNARAYGWAKTFARICYDCLKPSAANGDVTFDWRVNDTVINAHGHVFNPKEIARLISDSGLKVERRLVVDYETGQLRRLAIAGQLLFQLRPFD